jgi:hypothetical protein
MRKNSVPRRLNYKFWRGDEYWYINSKNLLVNQGTLSWLLGWGQAEPPHPQQVPVHRDDRRRRRSRPRPSGSRATRSSPRTSEPDDYAAAQLAQKVALWGYDEWRLRRVTTQAFTHAFVGGEGFVYPYWDSRSAPTSSSKGHRSETIGQGEVAHKVLSANEVYWEPGVDFDNSRWYCIEQARVKDEVEAMPGFFGGRSPTRPTPTLPRRTRPTTSSSSPSTSSAPRRRPTGRHIVIANGTRIVPEEDYPCEDHDGNILDEPLLVRISWTVEIDDRDRSLVEQLIDLQRTISDCWNKLLEWKNRCLNPQMLAAQGSNVSRGDDTPGIIRYYNPTGAKPPSGRHRLRSRGSCSRSSTRPSSTCAPWLRTSTCSPTRA